MRWTLIILCVLAFSFKKKDNANLYLEVKGIEKIQGNIMVAVYSNSENFPKTEKSFKNYSFNVDAKVMTLKLDGLHEGKPCAIAVYHDENGNQKLDENMFGMPTEKYGFSNNARETFSAPSFESAKVVVKDNKKTTIEIY
ncbi:MAG: hypothetical protein COA32_17275 [Fluviicola sp.]|nr:MAG: hypothetical protein COA32_17275 [Fluviicola sp.]